MAQTTTTQFKLLEEPFLEYLIGEYDVVDAVPLEHAGDIASLFAEAVDQGVITGPFEVSVQATDSDLVLVTLLHSLPDPDGPSGTLWLRLGGLETETKRLLDREETDTPADVVRRLLAIAETLIEPMRRLSAAQHLAANPSTPNGYDRRWIEAINQVIVDREQTPEGGQVCDFTDGGWERFVRPFVDAVEDQYHAGGASDFVYRGEVEA